MKTKRIKQIVDAMKDGKKLTIERKGRTTMLTLESELDEDRTFSRYAANLIEDGGDDKNNKGWDMRDCGAKHAETKQLEDLSKKCEHSFVYKIMFDHSTKNICETCGYIEGEVE